MKKFKLFLAALAAAVGVQHASAQTSPTVGVEVAAGEYYIYNIGSGAYLGKGSSHGTHAIVNGAGTAVTISGTSDAWLLHFAGIDASKYLGNGGWVDKNSSEGEYSTFTFEPVAVSGYTNVYKLKANNGGNYLYWYGGGAGDAYSAEARFDAAPATPINSYWLLVPATQRTDLTKATRFNPVDVTYLVNDPDHDVAVQTKEKASTTWSGDFLIQTNAHEGYYTFWLEKWVGTWAASNGTAVEGGYHLNDYKAYQTLTSLPAGKYRLSMKAAAVQQDTGEEVTGAYIYAGDQQTAVAAFGTYSVDFTADGTSNVEIGMKTVSTTANWVNFDGVRLYYLGNDLSSSLNNPTFDSNTDGWEGSKAAFDHNEGEFFGGDADPYNTFDMHQSVNSLANGVYAVEVQAFYRSGSDGGYGAPNDKRAKNAEVLYPELYATAGGATRSVVLLSMYDEAGNCGSTGADSPFGKIPQNMEEAQTFFQAGLYTDNKVIVEVTDGTLTLGLRKTTGLYRDWTLFDNFSLTKLGYSTLAEAYAAEWSSKKTAATNVLNDVAYAVIPEGDAARTQLTTALAATPADVDSYVSALATLRSALNGFKASKYAYSQFATVIQPAIDAESTTYAHVTGTEKTNFDTNVVNAVPTTKTAEAYYNFVTAQTATVEAFTAAKHSYNEYFYENETATRLGADVSSVTAPTTAAEAATAAHAINVINYNFLATKGYEDVSATVLGTWVDDNVGSRTSQHYDGNNSSTYFEQNVGWDRTAWSMSRQQTVTLSAGEYVLKVAARASANADAELSVTVGEGTPIVTYVGHHGDNGKGITTAGVASYDEGEFANTNGRGFEWRYIPFTLAEDGQVTLKFYAYNTNSAQWQFVSFTSLGIWTDPAVAAKTNLLTAINTATSVKDAYAGNVGTGLFQIPESAQTTFAAAITTAQGVYNNGESTKEQVTAATEAVNTAATTYQSATLNAPNSATRYQLTLANKGVLTFKDNVSTEGTYGNPFVANAGAHYAQSFFFTPVEGETNTYTLSFTDLEGNNRFICTRAQYGTGGTGTAGIRTFVAGEEGKEALKIKIEPAATANVFYMLNTENSNAKLGSNGGDFYTDNAYSDWSIAEAPEASVTVSAKAGKFGTVIFPFTPDVSEGFDNVKFYTVTETQAEPAAVLVEEVETLAANVPYLVKNNGTEDLSKVLTGYGTATADQYSAGLLTGVYTDANVAASTETEVRYVLQTSEGVQAFRKVDDDFTATAYRAFLSVTTAEGGVKAFALDFGTATAVDTLAAPAEVAAPAYNLAGQRVATPRRGIYVVGGKKVVR